MAKAETEWLRLGRVYPYTLPLSFSISAQHLSFFPPILPSLFPSLPSALELIKTAIEKAGFTDKVVIGMDVAASEFYREGKYDLDFKSPPDAERHISGEELSDIYQGFVNDYPGRQTII